MSEFLKHFAKRLTNLSAANRMLFLPRLSAGRHEDFFNLSHLERRSSFELLSDLVRERPVKICPVHDPRMESANQSSTRLRQLTRNVQAVFQETGAQDLHLAFLFVRGTFSNGTPVRAPLILIPVQLSVMDGHWVLCITAESRPALNKSFLYAYSHHQSMGSGEALPDDLFDEAESVQDFKTALLDSFQKAGIDVNFQPDYFQDHITQFQSFKRIDFSKEHSNGTGILRVFPEAVLGIFPQSDSYLAPDYRSMIESGKYQTSSDFFQSLGCPEPMAEPAESRLVCAFPADPWQEQAIRKIKRGFSIVVEGPPGTGKSQLICNLVADALAAKKSVLVVSQKKAALDVVWDRLQQADLQSFTARVHDFRADRKTVVESIASQIQKLEDYRQLNRSVDAIQLERQFQKSSNRIDQIVEQLGEFRTALADEQVCGMSIKEMYLHADAKIPVISLRNELHLLRMDQSDDLERKIHVLATLRQVIEKEAPSWRQRVSFSEMDQTDLKRLIKLLESFHHDMEELTSPIVSLSSVKPDFLQLQSLSADNEKIESLSSLLVPDEFGYLQRLFEHLSEEASDLWLANLQRMVESCFQGEGVESTLAHDQLGLAQQMLSRSVSAHKNIFSRLWWNIFSKDKFLIGRLMVVYGLRGLAGLHTLEKKLDNRLNLEHLLSKLQEQNWTFRIPGGYDADRIRHWFEATRRALRIRDTIVSSRILPQLFSHSIGAGDAERFLECASILQTQIKKFDKLQQKVLRYLTLRQVEELSADPDVMSQWSSELKAQFDRMQATDRIMEGFQDWEKGILERLEEAVPDQSPDYMVEVLHNSMLTAWIHYLEARSPVLRMIHSGELELMEIELQDLDLQKRKLGSKMVLQRARERMTEEISLNRLNNVVTYRELLHQVTKKRKIWPLRKLVSEFQDELFRLIPCWLASPESVSAVFPLEQNFDLVIFDEASQCYPEWGIPAMARGKQVVIAGDSQQLRPSDFYRIRWNQDNEEPEPEMESESLLEMVRLQLPVMTLQAHYRSFHPDLIAFSNRNFYQNRLQHLPDREYYNSRNSPFEYLNVQGSWENQANQKEAEAVLSLIKNYTANFPSTPLGVITFNHVQQQLIMDLVENDFAEQQKSIPTDLFIKNIENVQGDERDVIIFSIGYAPNRLHKVLLQFGSLNQEGGINRLNVAITRARQKIIVVTSIEPGQLNVDEVKSSGPAMLKSWLEYVKEHSVSVSPEWQSPPRGKELSWYLSDRILRSEELSGKITTPPFSFADLITLKEGKFHSIIMTDDERYLQAPSPKFHHCFLPGLLKEKNWQGIICYSRSYWLDSEKLISEILMPRREQADEN